MAWMLPPAEEPDPIPGSFVVNGELIFLVNESSKTVRVSIGQIITFNGQQMVIADGPSLVGLQATHTYMIGGVECYRSRGDQWISTTAQIEG